MSEEKSDQLFNEFSKVENPVERAQISYLLHGKIASDQENGVPDIEKVETSMGENWLAAANSFERILKEDPDQAFKMAIQLATLPVNPDQKIEDINKWIRGDGPGMLGREELRGQLLDYLSNKGKSEGLVNKLGEYLSFDFSKIRDSKTAFEDPSCFLSLSTILLGLKLEKDADLSEEAKELSKQSRMKFNDQEATRVIYFYQELPDTKWLADELKSFEVK